MIEPRVSDQELRKMRDFVYPAIEGTTGTYQTTESWEHVKGNWRNDEVWLKEEYIKLRERMIKP